MRFYGSFFVLFFNRQAKYMKRQINITFYANITQQEKNLSFKFLKHVLS